MADPICRWRNSSIKQVVEFNTLLPLSSCDKKSARDLVEKRWAILGGKDFFQTPYQLAAQMGLYYEDEQYLHPRFSRLISIEEAISYMDYWGKHYYAPNPYTRSMTETKRPVILNNFLVNWVIDNEKPLFSEALKVMFSESIGNSDILINMINNFTEVKVENDVIYLKDNVSHKRYDNVYIDIDMNDKKGFFEYVGDKTLSLPLKISSSRSPLQQIFYGAPGTGKSHTIKESLGRVPKENIFRTTFHPDSDYSTFVGTYKPAMQKQIDRIYTKDELISKLTEMKEWGLTYSPQKFGAKYWRSLKLLSLSDKKEILQACKMSENYTVEFDKGVAIGEENLIGSKESRIVYSFVAQAFLHAYLQAYRKSDENVYLIIEEINRGNCAQIFGDLFQLLDRNEQGSSEYAIKADADIKAYLEEELGADNPGIKNGELCLPANLFIWATMNTSDQSLFPIDSAFKRRWEWKYIPISEGLDKNGNALGYKIATSVHTYDWWSFLSSINRQIQDVTSSEDKKLGYFFVKADANGVISADKFVGKVAFYLWNDVFKDYGFDGEIFQGESGEPIAFQDFFLCDGKANEATVERFLKNLGVETKETEMNNAATEI